VWAKKPMTIIEADDGKKFSGPFDLQDFSRLMAVWLQTAINVNVRVKNNLQEVHFLTHLTYTKSS